MKITCIKCGKNVSGMSGLQNHMTLRHTAPYGNRRDPQAAAVPPPCPIKKKLSQAKPSKVVIAEEVKTLAAGFDPREAAECSKKWIPPPEARSRQKVSFIWILILDWF